MNEVKKISAAEEAVTDLSKRKVVIAELKAKHAGTAQLDMSVKANYELCRTGIGELRNLRVGIEKRRKELVADAVAWQRDVNGMAKSLIGEVESIEGPMQAAKDAVDQAAENARKAKAEAIRIEQERIARERVEAEAVAAKALRDAEELRLKEEREKLAEDRRKHEAEVAIEKARLAAERELYQSTIDKQREVDRVFRETAERVQREAQEKIDSDRRKLEAERDAQERAEFEKQAREKAERDAAERVEQQRVASERAAAAKAEADRIEAVRIESIRPDVEKVHEYGRWLQKVTPSSVQSREAITAITKAERSLKPIIDRLMAFKPEDKE